MFRKVLVANRSEIAVRVMRALRELGIRSVAIYSDVDANAIHTHYADEAYPLAGNHPKDTYLNIKKIIDIAKNANVDAIHPGYGFLAENPSFAYACEKEGIVFIGPSSRAIELMGNKVVARQTMKRAGVPVVPGSDGEVKTIKEAQAIASEIGYPVLIKASAGGGGIGMQVVQKPEDLERAMEQTMATALSAFGDASIFIEKYVVNPRHIEFQVLADRFGNVIHLGERECTIQRRHQKILEESPSPVMTEELRHRMGEVAVRAAQAIQYVNAGTIEFIYSDGNFYFIEMNTRIQVEHPVTEMVTGIDLVKEQIRIAAGEPLSVRQEEVRMHGHAIECRINAEDPLNNFAPSPGKLLGYRSPGGVGVRVDSGVFTSYTIPPFYDPMISKLVVWGRDRNEAIRRMQRALYEYIIVGPSTNIPFLKAVLANERFRRGEFTTHFVREESTLLQETARILLEEHPLQEKLQKIFRVDKKIAAAVAAAQAVLHHYENFSQEE
ncbi:MAG: acetyl-CoA carboxylase biotin carboxylase subunit [Atribacterota bacterium]|nr:acetyl-CoA carboxylase biotin carboxylase subunit [Atribacterota bacterium]